MNVRKKILTRIKNESSLYLISHMLPDGDSIGSLLAMGLGLRSLGKEVKLFTPGVIPRKYAFLKGAELVSNQPFGEDPSLTVIVLDSSDLDRLGLFREPVAAAKEIINIDHHVTNQQFGTINYVDPKAAATGELVYGLLKDLKVELNRDIAEAIYVALATDTGSFKYENTTAQTHQIIADLFKYDLSPGSLSQSIFDERPLPFYLLLRDAIASLEMNEDQKIALMTLSKDIRERNGASTDDLDGIVNYTRNIEGVELGMLFYIENENEVKVGFRSKTLDVSHLAGKFNGGGHVRAAGCRMQGQYKTVKNKIVAEAKIMLKELEAKE